MHQHHLPAVLLPALPNCPRFIPPRAPPAVTALPQFLRDLLASPPRSGEGVHAWLFRMARQLHAHYQNSNELARLLTAAVSDCGRHVSLREIEDAIAHSAGCAWQPGTQVNAAPVRPPAWPKPNPEQIEAIARDGGGLADLWEVSPTRIEDNAAHSEVVVDRLFPANPLLCCGASQSDFDTRPREAWRGQLADQQFIVPSPMSTVLGHTKDGRPSKHTLSNTGPRRFLICEFDQGTTDTHAAILLHLGGFAPLVCVVHSGGKSLHGWFYVAGQPEDKVAKFFRYAAIFGADPHTWTRSQFVRMPDGTRNNGRRQTIYFLNFKPLEAT